MLVEREAVSAFTDTILANDWVLRHLREWKKKCLYQCAPSYLKNKLGDSAPIRTTITIPRADKMMPGRWQTKCSLRLPSPIQTKWTSVTFQCMLFWFNDDRIFDARSINVSFLTLLYYKILIHKLRMVQVMLIKSPLKLFLKVRMFYAWWTVYCFKLISFSFYSRFLITEPFDNIRKPDLCWDRTTPTCA